MSSIPDTKHPLSGVDPESYSILHVIPLVTNQKKRVTASTWRSIYRITPKGWSSTALVGCPPMRETLASNLWSEDLTVTVPACKAMDAVPCAFFLGIGAQNWLSECCATAFQSWIFTTFLKIAVNVTTIGLREVCKKQACFL